MARYGRDFRDYDETSRGGRFWGPERHRFEGLFSRRDRDDLDRGTWDRDDRGWIGGGRYDRDYDVGGMGMGGMSRGNGRDYTVGGPGYTGGSSLGRGSSWDPRYRGGMVHRRYGGDFDYGSDVSEMGGSLRHDYIGRDTGWNRARDDFRAGGWNRGGDWNGDGDRDMGDRLREGWNDLQRGARRVFRGRGNFNRYDRNW